MRHDVAAAASPVPATVYSRDHQPQCLLISERTKAWLNGILTVQIEKGDLDGALATAEKIDDNREQTIARVLADSYGLRATKSTRLRRLERLPKIHLPGTVGARREARGLHDFVKRPEVGASPTTIPWPPGWAGVSSVTGGPPDWRQHR